MKNIFNKFAFFIALSFVFISCGNLTTSENDDSIPQGKGKITISTDLQNGRSVLPTAITKDTTGLKWELVGTKDGTPQTIKSWTDDNSGTAYQSMTSDSKIVIDTGTWDFTLTASLTASQNNATEELNVLQAHCNSVQISAGNNALNFVMQEATGDHAASGSIEFTLNFPETVVTKGIATLTPYEGTNPDTQEFTADAATSNQFLSSITYINENISAGYYILKIELQQNVGVTTEDFRTINTYSCLIRVAPGLLSQGKYTLPDLAQLYTINYKLEGGKFTNSATTTSYNAYTSFALPEPTFDGHYFAGWYTQEYADDGTLEEEKFFGNASDIKTISEDITLYAKWKISWDGLKNQIENDSGISEFVITEDLTATSTITVSKPVKIISDKNVTITRGNSIDGANFKDAFFEVESAGNLELEGTENITITLDGGKANESPIFATAPLITSSGNLTLTNCILRNNKNESTSVKGGAINISGGTFTMNGGIIGEKITETDTGEQSWKYAATDSNFSNYAYAGGGGIYVASGDVTINGGKISYNYTRNPGNDCQNKTPENTAAGGGISIETGSLSLTNSEVSYNSGYQGGGIRCYNDNISNAGTLTLNGTLIKGNTSNPYNGSSFGGGLMVKNFNVTFEETTKSTIEQNYSGDGGALCLENTTSTLKNITIQNNSYNSSGYRYGSELLLWANANISIDSSNAIISADGERGVFINNSTNTLKLSGDAKLDAPVYLMGGTTVTVAGYLTSNTTPVATITPDSYVVGTQVLTADDTSLLAQSVGKFALTDTDYKISDDGTVAQNSGSGNELLIENAYYVSANGNDSNNGRTYDTPFKTLNKAITSANNSDSKTVYVIGTLNATSESSSDNETVFFIAASVGTADSPINIIGYPDSDATLSALDDTGAANKRVFETDLESYIKMKDLILTGGNTSQSGAAIYYYNGELTLEDCKINGNKTTYYANSDSGIYYDGIYMYGSSNKLNMKNTECTDGIYLYNCTANFDDDCLLGYDDSTEIPIIHINNSSLNLGDVYFSNSIYSDAKSPICLTTSLTKHSNDEPIYIKLPNNVEGNQIISATSGVTLSEEVKKFTLSDTNYTISDDGMVAQNSGGGE